MDERRWSARSDVFTRHSATALIVLPAEGPGLKLNGPAERIWVLTHRPSTAQQIANQIADEFGEVLDAVEPFVIETLEQLAAHGAVAVR